MAEVLPSIEQTDQPGLAHALKRKLMAGVLAASAILTPNLITNEARAEGTPEIIDISNDNTVGYEPGDWRKPELVINPVDDLPFVAAIKKPDNSDQHHLGVVKFGNFSGSEANTMNFLDRNLDSESDISAVVRNNGRPVVFAGDKDGSAAYDCLDSSCDTWNYIDLGVPLTGISANKAPDGTIGVAMSGRFDGQNKNQLRYIHFSDDTLGTYTNELINDSMLLDRATGEVDLVYDEQNTAHISFTDRTDIKAAKLNDESGVAEADITAMETEDRTQFDLSSTVTDDGLRTVTSETEHNSTRVAARQGNDFNNGSAVTMEVLLPGRRGNSMQLATNGDLITLTGSYIEQDGETPASAVMDLLVCPERVPEEGAEPTADCADANILAHLDVVDDASAPSFKVHEGKSVAAYIASPGDGQIVRIISGSNETFNVDPATQGQQQQAQAKSSVALVSPELPANPLEGVVLARDHKAVAARAVINLCAQSGNSQEFCRDTLWPEEIVPEP